MSTTEPLGIRRRGLEHLRAQLVDIARKTDEAGKQMKELSLHATEIGVTQRSVGEALREMIDGVENAIGAAALADVVAQRSREEQS